VQNWLINNLIGIHVSCDFFHHQRNDRFHYKCIGTLILYTCTIKYNLLYIASIIVGKRYHIFRLSHSLCLTPSLCLSLRVPVSTYIIYTLPVIILCVCIVTSRTSHGRRVVYTCTRTGKSITQVCAPTTTEVHHIII